MELANRRINEQNKEFTMNHNRFPNMRYASAVICLFLACFSLEAQTEDGGTLNILHEVGVNARAFSLGRAYVAIADDPSAIYWNPAGLEYVPRMSLSLFHTPLIEGASSDFVGFVYPTLQFGTVGIGFSRLGAGGDITYRGDTPLPLSEGNDFDFSEIYVSYAKKLPFSLSAGMTYKVHRQNFTGTDQVNSAFGIDGGLMYRPEFEGTLFSGISVGLQIQNLFRPPLKLGSVDDNVGRQYAFGIIKGVDLGPGNKLNILLDLSKGEYEGMRFHGGTEYVFREMGTIRVGLDQTNPAFGAGVFYRSMQLDYAFGSIGSDGEFPGGHRFTFTYNIGQSREEKIRFAEEERRRRDLLLVQRTKEVEKERRIKDRMDTGKVYLNDDRFFDAYAEFQQVISEDAFNKEAKALFDSARAMIQTEFDNRQRAAITREVDSLRAEENRKFTELHFEKGNLFLQNKQFTDALIEFNLVLERDPDNPIVTEAINTTKRRLNSEVRQLITRGRAAFQQGNYSDALQILSEALVLSPDSDELKREINTLANRIKIQQFVQRGLALMQLGEFQQALDVFKEAQQLDPTDDAINRFIQRSQRGLGVDEAEMDPEAERQRLIATDLFLKGRYQEALDIWNKLAEKYPYNRKLQEAIKTAEERIKRTR